jgi:hypothetical protein
MQLPDLSIRQRPIITSVMKGCIALVLLGGMYTTVIPAVGLTAKIGKPSPDKNDQYQSTQHNTLWSSYRAKFTAAMTVKDRKERDAQVRTILRDLSRLSYANVPLTEAISESDFQDEKQYYIAMSEFWLGKSAEIPGDWNVSLGYYDQAYRRLNTNDGFERLKRSEKSLEHRSEAWIDHQMTLANILQGQANDLYKLGRVKDSLNKMTEVEAAFHLVAAEKDIFRKDLSLAINRGIYFNTKGLILTEIGRVKEGRVALEQAHSDFSTFQPDLAATALMNIGDTYASEEKWAKAGAYYNLSLAEHAKAVTYLHTLPKEGANFDVKAVQARIALVKRKLRQIRHEKERVEKQ